MKTSPARRSLACALCASLATAPLRPLLAAEIPELPKAEIPAAAPLAPAAAAPGLAAPDAAAPPDLAAAPLSEAQLRQGAQAAAAAPAALGGLFDGGRAPAPSADDPGLEGYADLLEHGLRSDADVERAFELISAVSPGFGKVLVDAVRGRRIPVKVGDAEFSHAAKSLHSLVNRRSVWASSVTLRRGAPVLELIHELAHAVPMRRLPSPLDDTQNVELDPKASPQELHAKIVELAEREEGVAFASEVRLADDLEAAGIGVDYEMIFPGARAIFASGGAKLLGQFVPIAFPYYKTTFESLAAHAAPLIQRGGDLTAIPWADRLDALGVETGEDRFSRGKLVLDARKLKEAAAGALARGQLGSLAREALDHISGMLSKWRALPEPAAGRPPASLPPVAFAATHRAATPEQRARLSQTEQTADRVRLSGSFLSFLRQADEAAKGSLEKTFSETATAAKRLEGEPAARLWTRLDAAARADLQKKPDQVKTLGFALIDAGATEQGRAVLDAYVDAAGGTLYPIGQYDESPLGKFMLEVAEAGHLALVRRLDALAREKLAAYETGYRERAIEAYGDYDGKLSEEGRRELDAELAGVAGHLAPADLRRRMDALAERGLYEPKEDASASQLAESYEESHFESLAKLTTLGGKLVETADKVAAAEPALAAELRRTAAMADGLAMTGALGRLHGVIHKWTEEHGVAYDGDLMKFIAGMESSPTTSREYDFAGSVADKAQSVGWALNRRGDALDESLPFYEALPDADYKVDLLAGALEKAKDPIAPALVLRAARDWQDALDSVAPRRDPRGRGGPFDRPGDRQRRKLQSLAKRMRDAERALGMEQDHADVALRTFLTRNGADKLRAQLPTMDTRAMAGVLNQFNKDEAKFQQLLDLILQLGDPLLEAALLRESLWALPGADYQASRDIPPRLLSAYLARVDMVLRTIAHERGLPAPASLQSEPPAPGWRETFFYRDHEARLALSLIRHGDRRLRALGRARLLALDGSAERVPSPRQLVANRGALFGRDEGGGSIYTLEEYLPAELKFPRLLDAAEADWAERDAYLAEARRLAPLVRTQAGDTEDWAVVHENLRGLMKLAQLLARDGKLDEAESFFQRVQQRLHALSAHFVPLHARDGDKDYHLKSVVQDLEFWTQDLDSRQSALLVRWGWSVDRARAERRLHSLLEAFEKDLALRRDRFDARSMIAAASELEEVPALRPQAKRIYELATKKVALLRGNKDLFGAASDYLIDRIDRGALPDAEKDELLTEAIRLIVPPKGKRRFLEMSETTPGLFTLAKRLIEEKRHPKAEKEILAVLADIVADVTFDRSDWKNDAKLAGLGKLFDSVLKADPELAMGESFPALAAVAADSRYQEALALLLPDEWQAARKASGAVLTRAAIRSGLADVDEARGSVLASLDAALASGDGAALRAALSLYREVLDRELNLYLAAHDNEVPSLAELRAVPAVAELERRLDAGGPEALAEALLGGDQPAPARARFFLYKELLGRDDVPLERRRLAFEGLITGRKISSYAESFFRHDVLGGTVPEARFYGWIRRLLDLNKDELLKDEVLAWLFQNPGEDGRFLAAFERSRARELLWRHLVGLGLSDPDHGALDDFNNRSAAQLEASRARLGAKYPHWTPELFDELELLLAHEVGFDWTNSFHSALERLRAWYVDRTFSFDDRHKRYTAAQLEAKLAKVAPQVKLLPAQRAYLESFLQAQGNMSLAQLQTYLGLEFAKEQSERLMAFMHGDRSAYEWSIPEIWGALDLSEEDRLRLEKVIDHAEAAHESRAQKMRQDTIEVPEVFQKSIPLVRQALISYFKQLAFGQREAVLADFKTEGLTEAQAIKRFFEVTGNEKLGQFLSLRRDLVPEEYRRELESFQENVPASSFEEIRSTIENELGRPLGQVFAHVSPKPLKVGTIGEVYEVTLLDGSRAVVKVITPSRRKSIARNLERLKAAAAEVDRNAHRFEQRVDASRLYAEFERTINEELDLTLERKNALELGKALPPGVAIPAMPEELNTQSVLVQSFAEGQNPLQLSAEEKRAALAKLSDVFFDQILSGEVYHDDLHPGNIRVAADGRLTLLDFGRVGRLSFTQRTQLVPLLDAVRAKDVDALVRQLERMGKKDERYDAMELGLAVSSILLRQDPSPTAALSAVFFEAGSRGLEIDSAYLQLIKAVMTFEGTAHELDPRFDLQQAVQAKVRARLEDLAKRFKAPWLAPKP